MRKVLDWVNMMKREELAKLSEMIKELGSKPKKVTD